MNALKMPDGDKEEILRAINSVFDPSDIVELRILKATKDGRFRGTVSGYFDGAHRNALADAAESYSGCAPGVYVTLNPVNPAVMARAVNRVQEFAQATTSDDEILHRKWLFIDFDPKRPSGVSATDAEHEWALSRARACREWLTSQGWPEPILADSGNGAHLLYRIDLTIEE